jgi:hypothetical protein
VRYPENVFFQLDKHVRNSSFRRGYIHENEPRNFLPLQPASKHPAEHLPPSKPFHLKHIQPVHNHHSLDKIPLQVNMPTSTTRSQRIDSKNRRQINLHPIKLVTLNSSIPRPQMLQPPPLHLNTHRLLKNHQGFVSLAHDPLVWFLPSTRVWCHE